MPEWFYVAFQCALIGMDAGKAAGENRTEACARELWERIEPRLQTAFVNCGQLEP